MQMPQLFSQLPVTRREMLACRLTRPQFPLSDLRKGDSPPNLEQALREDDGG